MKPTNEKERKASILRFLGFFLLAILPICLAIFLLARVDTSENNYLRPLVQDLQVQKGEVRDLSDLENRLGNSINDLVKEFNTTSQNPSTNNSGEIANRLTDMRKALVKLEEQVESEDKKIYLQLIRELHDGLEVFNEEVYEQVAIELKDSNEGLNNCQMEVDDYKRELNR